MNNRNIIIIDEMHPGIVPGLTEAGFKADYKPDISREQLKKIINKYQGIIVRSKTNMDKEMLDLATNLKYIARAGAGVDKIDVEYCESLGIQILNAPEGNRDALGEHAIGMLLALFNKMITADLEVRGGIWDREGNRGYEVQGKKVGIIGYGNMGGAFAKRLSGFGCEVFAYDKYKKDYGDGYAKQSELEVLFREVDIISFHVPLTEETHGLYNYDFFQKFSKDVFLINSARGPIIPFSDLIRLLKEKKILGAALDVLENEKINKYSVEEKQLFNELIQMKNTVLTPHVGGWTFESYKKINDVLIEKITKFVF